MRGFANCGSVLVDTPPGCTRKWLLRKRVMIESQEKPLISFALLAYRQEAFVDEAVQGAFDQTYSPLEIILSDDRSPDGTFERLKQLADTYRGPHRVVLNQTPQNSGIAGHFNRVLELAKGELIVAAAGDDVSLPNRCAVIHDTWAQSGRRAFSIQSAFYRIDEVGTELGTDVYRVDMGPNPLLRAAALGTAGITGATHAFHRSVYDLFGPISTEIIAEDQALAFRSLILGEVLTIPTPLVKYRHHGMMISHAHCPEFQLHWKHRISFFRNDLAVRRQYLQDVQTALAKGILAPDRGEEMLAIIRKGIQALELRLELVQSGYLRQWMLWAQHGNKLRLLKDWERLLFFTLAQPLAKVAWSLKARYKPKFKKPAPTQV